MEKNNTRTLLISSKILDKTNEYNTPAVFMNIIQGFHTTRHIKDYKYAQQMHRHSYYELQYIMEGVCHFETDDNQISFLPFGAMIAPLRHELATLFRSSYRSPAMPHLNASIATSTSSGLRLPRGKFCG